MAKSKGKHCSESMRLQGYDYGSNGAYFITICTANRKHFFGDVLNGMMHCSEVGKCAEHYWLEIPKQFSFVKLGQFVIMPDHMHGILIINKDHLCGDAINRIPTTKITKDNPQKGGFAGNKNPMFHENISRIIRWYKGRCTYEMRKIEKGFSWQSLYYDHIIRNGRSYRRISEYIYQNPKKWR